VRNKFLREFHELREWQTVELKQLEWAGIVSASLNRGVNEKRGGKSRSRIAGRFAISATGDF
jgi:hypothetical protein